MTALSTIPLAFIPLLLAAALFLWAHRRQQRIKALVAGMQGLHAQLGVRPRHLPSAYRFLPFRDNDGWPRTLDREFRVLERKLGVRRRPRRASLFGDDIDLGDLTCRLDALARAAKSA